MLIAAGRASNDDLVNEGVGGSHLRFGGVVMLGRAGALFRAVITTGAGKSMPHKVGWRRESPVESIVIKIGARACTGKSHPNGMLDTLVHVHWGKCDLGENVASSRPDRWLWVRKGVQKMSFELGSIELSIENRGVNVEK